MDRGLGALGEMELLRGESGQGDLPPLSLCCPVQEPLTTCGHGALEL